MDNVVAMPTRTTVVRVNKTRLGKQYGVSARTIGRWMDQQGWRPGTPPPPGAKSAHIPESNQGVPSSAESAPMGAPTEIGPKTAAPTWHGKRSLADRVMDGIMTFLFTGALICGMVYVVYRTAVISHQNNAPVTYGSTAKP